MYQYSTKFHSYISNVLPTKPNKPNLCFFSHMWVFVIMYSLRKEGKQFQTVLMMSIRVTLEDFLSPNDLMLKAASRRELERCSRAKKRPKAHNERILWQRSQIFKETCYWICIYAVWTLNVSFSFDLTVGVRERRNTCTPGHMTTWSWRHAFFFFCRGPGSTGLEVILWQRLWQK